MTRIQFDKVSIKGVKHWRDSTGKKHQTTKQFWQTINPFNKTADGRVKGYTDILHELVAERDAWMATDAQTQAAAA